MPVLPDPSNNRIFTAVLLHIGLQGVSVFVLNNLGYYSWRLNKIIINIHFIEICKMLSVCMCLKLNYKYLKPDMR